MSDRLHRIAAAIGHIASLTAYAFDRLQARLFDAPWECGRNSGRTC